jgi:hypothetical protein
MKAGRSVPIYCVLSALWGCASGSAYTPPPSDPSTAAQPEASPTEQQAPQAPQATDAGGPLFAKPSAVAIVGVPGIYTRGDDASWILWHIVKYPRDHQFLMIVVSGAESCPPRTSSFTPLKLKVLTDCQESFVSDSKGGRYPAAMLVDSKSSRTLLFFDVVPTTPGLVWNDGHGVTASVDTLLASDPKEFAFHTPAPMGPPMEVR